MKTIQKLIFSALLVVVMNCLSASTAWAAEQAAIVIVSTGDFYVLNKGNKTRQLQRRSKVFVGDTLVTGKTGRGQVRFVDGAIISLRPETQLRIDDYRYGKNQKQENSAMTLIKGGFRTITGAIGKEHYKVSTSMATIGIRGTHYEAVIHDDQMYVALWDGGVTVTNDAGEVDLGLGADYDFAHIQNNETKPTGLLDAPEVITNDSQPQIAPDLSSNSTDTSPAPEMDTATELTVLADQQEEILDVLPTEVMPTTGSAAYATVASFSGTGSNGDLSNFNFSANVDFAAASIDGSLSFSDGVGSSWYVAYAGTYNGNTLDVAVDNTGSTIDGSNQIDGTITGNFIGPNAETVKGSFDLHDMTDATNTAKGDFTVGQ